MSKPEDSGRSGTLASFQELLLTVVKSCSSIDTRDYELASATRLLAELRPATLRLLGEARSLLGSLLDVCEIQQRPYPVTRSMPPYDRSEVSDRRFERAVDAAVAANRASLAAIEEIAFIAQLELGQRAERLERVSMSLDTAELLSECDSSLRRSRKSLNAVGLSIARAIGVPPLAEYRSELENSLAVRRALKKFRKRVTKGGDPAPHQLRDRFRYIANQIEILVSWDIYSGMRVRDRLLLRSLQQRALKWLQGVNATPEAGLRLWQDIAACLEMFALVNRRQELVEHDTALLTRCLSALEAQPLDSPVDPALIQQLSAAEGLDLELDALLERPALEVQSLRAVLEALTKPAAASDESASGGEPW